MSGQLRKGTRRLGLLALFGVCVLLLVATSQMLSLDDPNAPVTLVYDDPISPLVDTPTLPARQVREVREISVEVLGETTSNLATDGVILGEWTLERRGQATRFVLSEQLLGTVLTVILQSGTSTDRLLSEDPTDTGRLFTFAGETSDDTFVLADDGRLSLGDASGVWATLPAQGPTGDER